ncbi:MIB [Mytilus coruscus]|uniref:MIB n=1 Tax=Mytilus coruscus TaxID=42192 RepID=A0A6J8EKW3_MYTCO|nr:MIB [Mytilus coruscus]
MRLAVNISSDIRYLKNQSRDDIKRIISNVSNVPDTHDDCLDMVQDFSNPIKYFNNQGLYTDIKRNTLKLGDRVRRGPDWTNDDQDLGLPGTVIGQKRDNWSLTKECVLVEWDHGRIFSYLILANEMIAVGCRVVRGLDWKYGDHDGGMGTLGTVLDLSTERTVVVIWDSKNVGLYRFGFKGLFEVKLCDDLSNSMPYEQTKKSVYSEQKFKNKEPGSYRNNSETMITSERDKENYLIPLYSDTSVSAIWEYQNGLQWTKYPSGINVKIEKAYQRKKSGKIIIEMDRTTYIVNFSKMTQENANNKTEMAVRRKGEIDDLLLQ